MIIQKKLNLNKIKDLNNQIFDYLSLTFYDIDSQVDSRIDITRKKLTTFADNHFKNSIKDLLNEIEKINNNFPEVSDKIRETVEELVNKFEKIINNENFDLSSLEKLKLNLNKYLDRIIV